MRKAQDYSVEEIRQLSQLERVTLFQPHLRLCATSIGNFRHCALPRCRRARQCSGCHPPPLLHSGGYTDFPPCVTNAAEHSALYNELIRREQELEARIAALIAAEKAAQNAASSVAPEAQPAKVRNSARRS